jgi:pyridoxal phosphate enzyme (YggS family)
MIDMNEPYDTLKSNLQTVRERIKRAAISAGRDPDSVRLVAVSKTFPAADVAAAARCGQQEFGENYLQEFIEKKAQAEMLSGLTLQWHFIGPIQSNKTRAIAEQCDWVQSVDRLKIAQRLSDQRPSACAPLNVLLQVNISAEASKSGVARQDAPALAQAIAAMPRLKLRGLMAIPEPEADPVRQREPFRHMRELFDDLRSRGLSLDTLSMGMSDDLGIAIAEGSTMVRIGTAIFGRRS